MRTESDQRLREMHWMRHADRYLALVRAAVRKNPLDDELRELLDAMEAAVAEEQNRSLH